jgi:prepilin-type N-terminal cleavage/methylation domain-containing protein
LEADVRIQRTIGHPILVANKQRGFTLLEVLISMFVLTIGLVSLLGVVAMAMTATQTSQQDMIARQIAQEAMEAIYTARNTAGITFQSIQNVGTGQVPDGIFLTGLQPVYNPGVDGIMGTADDSAAGIQTLEMPGPSGVYTGNCTTDVCVPLNNYQRSISITPVSDSSGNTYGNLRQVTITVQYNTPQFKIPKQYVLNSYVSSYR